MTTAEAREQLHRLIDDLSPRLLEVVTEFVEFLLFKKKAPPVIQNIHPEHSATLSDEERLTRLNQLFGAWANEPDLLETFADMDRDRHLDRGRPLETWD